MEHVCSLSKLDPTQRSNLIIKILKAAFDTDFSEYIDDDDFFTADILNVPSNHRCNSSCEIRERKRQR